MWRERILGLREGSIIVVTLVVAIYFAANTSFFTSANFKTLLPYFAPFAILGAGEVFVMILGEIDLSIGGDVPARALSSTSSMRRSDWDWCRA